MVKLYINLPSVFIYAPLILWIAQGGVNDFSLQGREFSLTFPIPWIGGIIEEGEWKRSMQRRPKDGP